jgi:hypothetical protein
VDPLRAKATRRYLYGEASSRLVTLDRNQS